jgi:hypothetical protein
MTGLMIAAPRSGSGKTTVTLGLLRALKRRGVALAPGKAGPDYIDPAFHAAASGQTCLNYDPWAMRERSASGQCVAAIAGRADAGDRGDDGAVRRRRRRFRIGGRSRRSSGPAGHSGDRLRKHVAIGGGAGTQGLPIFTRMCWFRASFSTIASPGMRACCARRWRMHGSSDRGIAARTRSWCCRNAISGWCRRARHPGLRN